MRPIQKLILALDDRRTRTKNPQERSVLDALIVDLIKARDGVKKNRKNSLRVFSFPSNSSLLH